MKVKEFGNDIPPAEMINDITNQQFKAYNYIKKLKKAWQAGDHTFIFERDEFQLNLSTAPSDKWIFWQYINAKVHSYMKYAFWFLICRKDVLINHKNRAKSDS